VSSPAIHCTTLSCPARPAACAWKATVKVLVRREPAPDGRGVLVTLTGERARKFDTLAPRHLVNESRLVAALNPDQQAVRAALLQSLLVEYEPATPAGATSVSAWSSLPPTSGWNAAPQ